MTLEQAIEWLEVTNRENNDFGLSYDLHGNKWKWGVLDLQEEKFISVGNTIQEAVMKAKEKIENEPLERS